MKHKTQCECYQCKYGKEAAEKKEREGIERFGFYVHFVYDNKCPNGINIHTHGVKESFGHLDIQICINISQRNALGLLHDIVNQIKEGKVFVAGKKYSTIAQGYNTEFITATEGGRLVLRLVVPNPRGTYEGAMYANQFTMLDNH